MVTDKNHRAYILQHGPYFSITTSQSSPIFEIPDASITGGSSVALLETNLRIFGGLYKYFNAQDDSKGNKPYKQLCDYHII